MILRAIVTGASGFIGGRIAYYLARKDVEIFAPLRVGSKPLLAHKNIHIIPYEKIIELPTDKIIEIIIHCAALTTANCRNDEQILSVNSRLSLYITDWMRRFEPKHIIFMSTVSVYGKVRQDILRHDTEYLEPNAYGLSKIEAEKRILDASVNFDTSATILRLPGTVGYGSHGNIISKIIKFLNAEPSGSISLFNRQSLFNNIVSITSLLEFVEFLIDGSPHENKNLILLLGSKEPITFESAVTILRSFFRASQEKEVCWQVDETRPSFTIDCSHAMQYGYPARDTVVELKRVFKDLKSF
jgi:nucleoside-diphosphate-sugar epimerase